MNYQVCLSNIPWNTWKTSSNKPWFWSNCAFCMVHPLHLCVRASFSGEVQGIIYLEFQVRASCRGPGAPTERGGRYWQSDPPTSSPLLSPIPFCLVSFFLTEANSCPFVTFIDSLLYTPWPYSLSHLVCQTLFIYNLQLTLNAVTEAKAWDHTSLILLLKKQEPSCDHSLLDRSNLALPKTTLKAFSNLFSVIDDSFELTCLRSYRRINQCHVSKCCKL